MDLKLIQLRYKVNYLDIISYYLPIYLFETFKNMNYYYKYVT